MKKGLLLYLLFLIYLLPAIAQVRTLTGKVSADSSGAPLPGVTIQIKGSTYRTATAGDGTFTIAVAGSQELIFSMVGYASKEIKPAGNTTFLDVKLKNDQSKLSEVVIVGYGEQSKRYTIEAVSTVKAGAILNKPVVTPQQLLQGQAAGVQMVNSSGLIGGASLLRIRGAASVTADGQPLFVIDDVPLNTGQYNNAYGGGALLNPLMEINPNDIESITVLKDAAAAAIYGSRGSNGVILIKTKSGTNNSKTKVQLDYYTGWEKPTGTIDVLNAEEYRSFYNNYITKVTGKPTVDFPATGFDWQDATRRTGKTSNYALSASGGNDKTKFYVGGSYLQQESFVIGNDLKKMTGRLNLDHTMNKNVHFGVNFSTAYTNMDRIMTESGDLTSPSTAGYTNTPFTQAYDAQGQYLNPSTNALAVVGLSKNRYTTRRTTGNAYATINIIDGLSFKTDWGLDQLETEERYRTSEKIMPTGTAGRTIWQDIKWLNTNSLHFEKSIAQQHNIELLAAHSFETARYDDIKVTGSGFISDKLQNVASAATNTGSASGQEWALESYIFRGNYRYQDKYLAEASYRLDGSSRFGKNRKYGSFWAVSGGWVISQEAFMQDVKFLDYLKLTASYGVTGNDGIGYFSYLGLYGTGVGSNYANQPGLRPSQAPNMNLSWEETGQLDIGITAHALDHRIQVSVDYFDKESRNLLLSVIYPSTTGFGFGNQNVGKMRNKGVDLQITGVPVKNRDFTWTATLNAGFLKNVVKQLPPTTKDDEGRNFVLGTNSGQRAIQGYSLNSFYLIRYKGINAATGDPEWYTKNGEVTTTPTDNDQVIAGSAIPKVTGGFNNSFRYKNFDLGVNFYFSAGNKVMLSEFQILDNPTLGLNVSSDLLNYWQKPGDNAVAPSATSTTWGNSRKYYSLSTAQLFDGSFLRLKTLTLGYNLPANLLSNTHLLSSARVFVLGENLWTATKKGFRGADPEVSRFGANGQAVGESYFSIPQPKTITVGVNLVF